MKLNCVNKFIKYYIYYFKIINYINLYIIIINYLIYLLLKNIFIFYDYNNLKSKYIIISYFYKKYKKLLKYLLKLFKNNY